MSSQGNSFSNRERKTIILLSVVALFTLGVLVGKHTQPATLPQANPKPDRQWNTTDTAYRKAIEGRRQAQEEHYRRQAEHYRLQEEYYKAQDQYYQREIERYRQKNARRPTMPAIRSDSSATAEYQRLYPTSEKFHSHTLVDANTADSATLCSIPGIGKGISATILHYRQQLGGFHSTEQLLESKFFTADLLDWFTVSPNPQLRKIGINHATFRQLVSHPYISKPQAQDILAYIRRYGNIENADQLRSTHIFSEEVLPRLLPYIDFYPSQQLSPHHPDQSPSTKNSTEQ